MQTIIVFVELTRYFLECNFCELTKFPKYELNKYSGPSAKNNATM